MNNTLVEASLLEKLFGNVRAVDGLSFDVKEGEIFAILGPNGAGKTTVVRILLNILQPDSGTIQYCINGRTTAVAPRMEIGYLPEDRGLYKEVPIDRTLTYMGILRGMTQRSARRAADLWLERMDLLSRKKEKLDQLSKGNQQKVQFIASILHRPKFAILDEPFSGLDPVNQELFLELIAELRYSGVTILLCAHQMDLVQRLADRVILLNHGKSVLEGSIREILDRSATSKTIILRIDGGLPTDIFGRFDEVEHVEQLDNAEVAFGLKKGVSLNNFLVNAATQLTITNVRSKDPTLHEVYLQAIKSQLPVGGDGP